MEWHEKEGLFDRNEVLVKDSGNCLFIVDELRKGMLIDSNGNEIGYVRNFTLADNKDGLGLICNNEISLLSLFDSDFLIDELEQRGINIGIL